MNSPSPLPGLSREFANRLNRSNSRCCSSPGMPGACVGDGDRDPRLVPVRPRSSIGVPGRRELDRVRQQVGDARPTCDARRRAPAPSPMTGFARVRRRPRRARRRSPDRRPRRRRSRSRSSSSWPDSMRITDIRSSTSSPITAARAAIRVQVLELGRFGHLGPVLAQQLGQALDDAERAHAGRGRRSRTRRCASGRARADAPPPRARARARRGGRPRCACGRSGRVVTLAKPRWLPSAEWSTVMTTLAQNRVPSLRRRHPSVSTPARFECDAQQLVGLDRCGRRRTGRTARSGDRSPRRLDTPSGVPPPRFQLATRPSGSRRKIA